MKSTKNDILEQKKTLKHSIQGQFTFGIQLQTLPSKCNRRKFQTETWHTADENSFRTRRQLYRSVQSSGRKVLTSFFQLCLTHICALVQWHVCISRSSRFFLVFAGQKCISHFRHAHGHQWAAASRRSIKIIQNTFFAVNEVESQQTLYKKMGKLTVWFSEVIKEFYHYFREKKAGRCKMKKVKLQCFSKAHQLILQNPMVKEYKHF